MTTDTARMAFPGNLLKRVASATINSGDLYVSAEGNVMLFQGLKKALSGDAAEFITDEVVSFSNNNAVAFAEGQTVYWDGTNIATSGFIRIGKCANYGGATSSQRVLVRLLKDARGVEYRQVAAGTALTNSTTETAMAQTPNIPANYLQAGDILRFRYQGIITSFNSTNTLASILKFYKVTSAAAVNILAPTAYTGTANDIVLIEGDIVIRTIGSSGTFVAAGIVAQGANGTITGKAFNVASTTIDTTQPLNLQVTGTWSAQSGSNSARSDLFNVQHSRA